MLRPIPQSLLGDLAIIKVCTGMDAWQKPVWQDYEVSRVHLQNTNEVKKTKENTEVVLRSSLTPGFQGPSWIMILWRNIPKRPESLSGAKCLTRRVRNTANMKC